MAFIDGVSALLDRMIGDAFTAHELLNSDGEVVGEIAFSEVNIRDDYTIELTGEGIHEGKRVNIVVQEVDGQQN